MSLLKPGESTWFAADGIDCTEVITAAARSDTTRKWPPQSLEPLSDRKSTGQPEAINFQSAGGDSSVLVIPLDEKALGSSPEERIS